ncbi:hypothetical protein J5N97_006716 [Dioscorea zingiberensis]|uniref:DUF155 domain-containing protein n=1 Tax=Dioscorea zingiberensis TaxID=325984 RepID=A0A9D5DCM1_9LILI|nr:hypothetical protein J5N97_006716 [Dioscorea zingiberensis]
MEIWGARPLLRCIAHSSFALFKNTPQRSFQTLVRCPLVASSSSQRCLFVSQPQRCHPFLFFPQASTVVRTLKSLSWEQQSACSESEGKQSRVFPVKAYFLCTDIDLKSLQAQYAFNVITPNSNATNIAVYTKNYPHIVEKHASSFLPEIKKDDYVVAEKPTLDAWVQGGIDSILPKNLSIDGIGTIGSVLGQRIALDYYIRQVNQMITELEDINCQIGTFTLRIRKLLQPVLNVSSRLDFLDHELLMLKCIWLTKANIATDAQKWECLSTKLHLTEIISSLDLSLLGAMNRAWKLKFILTEKMVKWKRLSNIYVLSMIIIISFRSGLEAGFGIESNCRYMVVSRYGSIVMFNVPDQEADVYLKIVEKHASSFLPEIKKDDYVVAEKPTLDAWVQGGIDSILPKNLSIDGIGTIGSVLGQRIALEYYIRQVNQMITELEDINCQIGTFTLRIRKLLQPVLNVSSRLDFLDHKLLMLKCIWLTKANIATDAQKWECLSTKLHLTEIISSLDLSLLRAMGLEAGFGIESNCRYMVVSRYGSIVMFNVPDQEADVYLKIVEKHASSFLPEIKKDDYVVAEKPTLDAWVQGGIDSILPKNLSIDGIGTIGSVLGQRIALEYYIRQVNQMITELEDINCQIMNTGTFTLRIRKLRQLVSNVNSMLDFLDHKLLILKRAHIATVAPECLSTRLRLTEIISGLNLSLQRAMSRAWKLKFILTDKMVELEELFHIIVLGMIIFCIVIDSFYYSFV